MTACAKCQTPLQTTLDEYGPRDAPLCRSCYLAPVNPFSAEEGQIQENKKRIMDLRDDIADQIRFINDLVEDFEIGELDIPEKDYKRRLEYENIELGRMQSVVTTLELENSDLDYQIKQRKERERGRLLAWKASVMP